MTPAEEELVALLVPAEDYAYHIGQVISVGSSNLRVLRKQLSLGNPYKVEYMPISACSAVEYGAGVSVLHIVAGSLLLALMLGIFSLIGMYWSSLESGTRIQVGLLGLAFAYGVRWAFMSKRHRIDIRLKNGNNLRWRSRSGDFKYRERPVEKALEYFRSIGLVVVQK